MMWLEWMIIYMGELVADAVPGPSTAISENSTIPKSASVSMELSKDNVSFFNPLGRRSRSAVRDQLRPVDVLSQVIDRDGPGPRPSLVDLGRDVVTGIDHAQFD